MTDREALDRLIEAVEAGTLTWPEAQSWGHNAISQASLVWSAYHGSLDAAKALHEAVLPGWQYAVDGKRDGCCAEVFTPPEVHLPSGGAATWMVKHSQSVTLNEPNPARAWMLAILKALREKADD